MIYLNWKIFYRNLFLSLTCAKTTFIVLFKALCCFTLILLTVSLIYLFCQKQKKKNIFY